MPEKVTIGVVGVGGMGRLHARNAMAHIPAAAVVAVADPDVDRARAFASTIGVDRVYADPAELVEDRDVSALVIASPLPTHAEWIIAAAGVGKDVFCEKPLAVDMDGATRAVEAVRRAGIRAQIGFNRHFDPAYVHAREVIESGAIGEPVVFKAITRDRLPPPIDYLEASAGAGMLVDTAVHDYDLARWLMADEVARVQACGGVLVAHDLAELQGPDAASVNLCFRRGAIGNVETFRAARYGDDVRTEVVGSAGSLIIGGTARLPVQVLTDEGLRHEGYPDHFDRFRDSYLNELTAFIDAIVRDTPAVVNEEDGIRAVEIAVAARRSLEDEMTAVVLPLV